MNQFISQRRYLDKILFSALLWLDVVSLFINSAYVYGDFKNRSRFFPAGSKRCTIFRKKGIFRWFLSHDVSSIFTLRFSEGTRHYFGALWRSRKRADDA